MLNFQKIILVTFVLVFLGHGFLYYLFPQYHYLEPGGGGWISYIKYFCLMILIPSLVRYRFNVSSATWLYVGCLLLASTLGASIFWVNEINFLLIQYQIPILAFFFAASFSRHFADEKLINKYIFILIMLVAASLIFELIYGGLIANYSRSGFRGVGPFVNPNNTGIFVSLMAAIFHFYERRTLYNVAIALVSVFIIFFTGSKTAMLLYIVCLVFMRANYWRYFLPLSIGMLLAIFSDEFFLYWEALELRAFSAESGSMRIDDASVILDRIFTKSFLDLVFGFSSISIVDNAYLDMLSFGGLSILLPFLVAQLASFYLSCKFNYKLIIILHLMFFASMLTTNIPRLWPVAYLYWAVVGISFFKSRSSMRLVASGGANYPRKVY